MLDNKRSLVALLLVVVVLSGWQLFQSQRRQAALEAQLLAMQAELENVKGELGAVQEELDTLEKTSVKGAIREANEAILSGWEALMNTVESELSRAREELELDAEPQLESPDGTDRT